MQAKYVQCVVNGCVPLGNSGLLSCSLLLPSLMIVHRGLRTVSRTSQAASSAVHSQVRQCCKPCLYLHQVHGFHCLVHALHNTLHGARHLVWVSGAVDNSSEATQHTVLMTPTCFMVTAVCTRCATASTRADILRKLRACVFCRMAFSA